MNTPTQITFIPLAAYGDWDHHKGLQRLTPEAARFLCHHFNTGLARLSRGFRGLPVYLGHPDDAAECDGTTAAEPLGRITALRAGSDALECRIRWSPDAAFQLPPARPLYLSPRWVMRPASGGAFTPVKLLSAGLTRTPNIPGPAVTLPVSTDALRLLRALGLCPSSDTEGDCQRIAADAHQARVELPRLRRELDRLHRKADRLRAEAAEAAARAGAETARAATLTESNAAERAARIELLLDTAVRDGRIPAGERAAWAEGLRANFEHGNAELSAKAPVLPTASRLDGLEPPSAEADFLSAVRRESTRSGDDFARTWTRLKRERRDLYARLQR